jgi:deoxycytidine triphosphate deaminase
VIPPAKADDPTSGSGNAGRIPPGLLLTGNTLLLELDRHDNIFRAGSWTKANVRGPGYDLRLAGDLLVYPVAPGAPNYRVVDRHSTEVTEFTLAPGDAALVSTIEKLSLDVTIAATIGHKWLFAARGLLMLTGNAVHPGYGRRYDAEKRLWSPKEDERLHFVVANVGPDDISLRKGDRIAYLQFFSVEPAEQAIGPGVEGFELLRDRLFSYQNQGSPAIHEVAYFRTVRGIGERLRSSEERWQASLTKIEHRTAEHEVAINRQTDVTSLIIVFGVFLISATLLGFVLTTLAGLVEKFPVHLSAGRSILILTMAVVYGLCCALGVSAVTSAVWSIIRRRARRAREECTSNSGV